MARKTETEFDRVFEALAAKQPSYATTAGYAFGGNAPQVLVAGPRAKNDPTPVPQGAAWHIGSITKSFTASLVMQQVEAGTFELDAPIGKYIDPFAHEIHPTWAAITLRQLLSHTSGLIANPGQIAMWKNRGNNPRVARLSVLQDYWSAPVNTSPGKFVYSNLGYTLAGLILENMSGVDWEKLVISDIMEPLGLRSAGHGPPNGTGAPIGHQSLFGFKRAVNPASSRADNPEWMAPAGSLHMSIEDLIGWGQAMQAACAGQRGAIVSKTSCATLQMPIANDYALGWVVQTRPDINTRVVWHNGSNTMWYTVLALIPEYDLTVAVSHNKFDPRPIEIALQSMIASLIR